MEITCNRCHQAVEVENCYCPACGLPQLVYGADAPAGQSQPVRWDEAVPDASSVDWKPALRAALLLAIPAGVLSFGLSAVGLLGFVWMAVAGAWAVAISCAASGRRGSPSEPAHALALSLACWERGQQRQP